jgi:hypothetical protein
VKVTLPVCFRLKTVRLGFVIGAALTTALIPSSSAAQVFYHKQNDAAAQKAVEQDKDASLAVALNPALNNIGVLEEKEAAIEFENMARVARASIDDTRCWGDVIYAVCTLKTSPPAPNSPCLQIAGKIRPTSEKGGGCKLAPDAVSGFSFPVPNTRALEGQAKELKTAIEALKASVDKTKEGTSSLASADDAVKKAQNVFETGTSLLSNTATFNAHKNEATAAKDALDELSNDLSGLEAIEKKRKDLADKLKSVGDPLATLESDRLQALLNHVEALLRIAKLRDQEEAYLQDKIIATFEHDLERHPPVRLEEPIENVFAACAVPNQSGAPGACDRERLADFGEALELYASALIWGQGIERLNELRTAREAHRFSIEASIVDAKAADLVISAGVQRLALYHQGGIKPEVLAQLIYAAATIGVAAR